MGLATQLVAAHGGVPFHYYQFAIKGFAVANLPAAAVIALRNNPMVLWVREDGLDPQADIQFLPLTAVSYRESTLWALDRVDERDDVFDGRFNHLNCGSGSHVYILDTGIRGGHTEWGYGRIGTSVTRLSFSYHASPTIDQDGHGTQVASAAAGGTYGIAKCATLHSVRINDNDSAWHSDIIAGLDWVAGNHVKPAVANLSYVGHDFGVRDALEGVIRAGVVMVKAAGNDGVDAYQKRGNRAQGLIVVGSSTRNDNKSGFSDYGSTLTLFAPGTEIFMADKDADDDVIISSGTSFAAPFVAGAAAVFLNQQPSATPARIKHVITTAATQNELSSSSIGSGSPNRLLFTYMNAVEVPDPSYGWYPTAPEITTPDAVKPGRTCWWMVSTGSSNPVSYEWYVNEVPQSETGYILWYTSETAPFEIEVRVHDSDGTIWTNYRYVTVSADAAECPDVM